MKAHAINLRTLPNPKAAVYPFSSGNIAGEQYMTAKLDAIHERNSEETPAGDEKTAPRLTDRMIGTLSSKLTRLEGPKIDKGIVDGLRMLAEWVRADRSSLCFLAGENRKVSDVREWCRRGIEPKHIS